LSSLAEELFVSWYIAIADRIKCGATSKIIINNIIVKG